MSGEREKGVIFSSQFPDMLRKRGGKEERGKRWGCVNERQKASFNKVESQESAN